MKKLALSFASISTMLSPLASADEIKTYAIKSPTPIASLRAVKSGLQSRGARTKAIALAQDDIAAQARKKNISIRRKLKTLGAISFANMNQQQVNHMLNLGYRVEEMHPVHLVNALQPFEGITVAADGNDYDIDTYADALPYGIETVRAHESWPDSTGNGVKVCVIDTGMDLDHSDLMDNYVMGISTADTGNANDVDGHGTHVAGTIAASLNDSGVVGVAPEASLYIARVFASSGSTTNDVILEGLDWCVEQGTQVINMSYGGSYSSTTTEEMYQDAFDAGVVMVAATGNSGIGTIYFPAAYDTTIAVGATDSNDALASFSQYGPEMNVVAPGVSVLSAANGGGAKYESGTSMAAPHVTGAVAALLGYDGSLTSVDVQTLLENTAVDLGASGWDTYYGYGRIDLRAALNQLQGINDNTNPGSDLTAVEPFAVTVSDLSAATGESLNYSIAIPSGVSTLSFTLAGGSGDADLYIKQGSSATTSDYDCRPYLTGNDESCAFNSPASDTWHILIYSYSAFSGLSLSVSYE